MTCPRCGSGRYSSNALFPISDDQFAQGVQIARTTRRPALEACAMAVWAVHRAVNAIRDRFVCDHCGHTFNEV